MTLRILTIILVSVALCSCSSSEHDEPIIPAPEDGVGITFSGSNGTWQDAPTGRATTTGLETLHSSFKVWGYKTTNTTQTVMNGYEVNYTNDWNYIGINNQTVKFWDYSASDYRFFAYTPKEANITTSETNNAEYSFSIPYSYTPTATATSTPYISELWMATKNTPSTSSDGISTPADPSTTPAYGKCVTLTFSPLIAKVRFKFSYPDGTSTISIHDIEFRDVRFAYTPEKATTPLHGTIKATYPIAGTPTSTSPKLSWEDDGTSTATRQLMLTTPYETADDAIHIITDTKDYNKWYYVPPFSDIDYKQGAYIITARINGNKASASVPEEFMQWKHGYQYTYIFKITEAGNDITFADLQVEEWATEKPVENNGGGTEGW